jgi:hypothetical protein
MMVDRIESAELVKAGLAAMESSGRPLKKLASKGRAMLYAMPDGKTVRLRTCNDHLLIVVGDRPTADAKLNIEGTDWLLIVMPEIERTPGRVHSYLIPTSEVEAEARRTHQAWLASNPNTKGDNRTWNLWFRSDGPQKASGYAEKWARYRLKNEVDVRASAPVPASNGVGNVRAEVEIARRRIAEVAGVPVESVKITINFEG